MKIKDGFVIRDVAGSCVVVPVGADLNFNGMITLNETGKTLWTALGEETDIDGLVSALTSEYDVDADTAKAAAENFVNKLRENGFINE